MSDLKSIDKSFTDNLSLLGSSLRLVEKNILDSYNFDLQKREISDAILNRMRVYYEYQNELKEILHKKQLAAASDFFVEAVLFFLRALVKHNRPELSVVSEQEITIRKYQNEEGKNKREVLRPDIAIYRGDTLRAIIECKTQLGRTRTTWEKDFQNRKQKLATYSPDTLLFLLVMTKANWQGFQKHASFNYEYFCLIDDLWPTNYSNPSQILSPIEFLFERIVNEC